MSTQICSSIDTGQANHVQSIVFEGLGEPVPRMWGNGCPEPKYIEKERDGEREGERYELPINPNGPGLAV